MNFMEAVKAMKEGNKVKIKEWGKHAFFCYKGCFIYDEEDKVPTMMCNWIESTDWEIVEEKKTLSDLIVPKEHDTNNYDVPEHLKPEDVKEAIKEFIDTFTKLEVGHLHEGVMFAKAKEIFGEKLVRS